MIVIFRIIVDLILLLAIFIMPWWLSLLLIIAAIFYFNTFYESVIFAILLDGFYGIPGLTFYGINAFFTTVIGVIFILLIFLKPRLKFY